MTTRDFPQSCPLCESAATYCRADRGNRKYFTCDSCGEFQISGDAEGRLLERTQARRRALSQRSKNAPTGQILVIVRPRAGESTEPFVDCYVDRSEVPDCD